jgi:hypothetical protein
LEEESNKDRVMDFVDIAFLSDRKFILSTDLEDKQGTYSYEYNKLNSGLKVRNDFAIENRRWFKTF